MLEFIQNSMLWSLFEFVGGFAWFLLIGFVLAIFGGTYAVLQWIFRRLF